MSVRVLFVAAAVLTIMSSGCGPVPPIAAPPAEKAKEEPQTKKIDWGSAESSKRIGDLHVEIVGARNATVMGWRDDQISNFDAMVVQMRIENFSPTKVIRFGGIQGSAKFEDEHGNQYGSISLHNYRFDARPALVKDDDEKRAADTSKPIVHGETPIHPGARIITYLIYERFAAVSGEIRLTIPGRKIELGNDVHLRAKLLERPKARQKK